MALPAGNSPHAGHRDKEYAGGNKSNKGLLGVVKVNKDEAGNFALVLDPDGSSKLIHQLNNQLNKSGKEELKVGANNFSLDFSSLVQGVTPPAAQSYTFKKIRDSWSISLSGKEDPFIKWAKRYLEDLGDVTTAVSSKTPATKPKSSAAPRSEAAPTKTRKIDFDFKAPVSNQVDRQIFTKLQQFAKGKFPLKTLLNQCEAKRKQELEGSPVADLIRSRATTLEDSTALKELKSFAEKISRPRLLHMLWNTIPLLNRRPYQETDIQKFGKELNKAVSFSLRKFS